MWKRVCTDGTDDESDSSLCVGIATFMAVWSVWTTLDSLVAALPTLPAAALVSVSFVLSCRRLLISAVSTPDTAGGDDDGASAARRAKKKRPLALPSERGGVIMEEC
jgi:hypothetical protein